MPTPETLKTHSFFPFEYLCLFLHLCLQTSLIFSCKKLLLSDFHFQFRFNLMFEPLMLALIFYVCLTFYLNSIFVSKLFLP